MTDAIKEKTFLEITYPDEEIQHALGLFETGIYSGQYSGMEYNIEKDKSLTPEIIKYWKPIIGNAIELVRESQQAAEESEKQFYDEIHMQTENCHREIGEEYHRQTGKILNWEDDSNQTPEDDRIIDAIIQNHKRKNTPGRYLIPCKTDFYKTVEDLAEQRMKNPVLNVEMIKQEEQQLKADAAEIEQAEKLFKLKQLVPASYTCKGLMEKVFNDPIWIIPHMLSEGVTTYAASPKTGKTWAALQIAIAASCNGKIFGELPVIQVETLYLALEDSPRRIQSRLKFMGVTPTENLHFANQWAQGTKGLEQIEIWKILHPDTKFIIIDTLQAFRGVSASGQQSYAEDYESISSLKKLADRLQITVLILHHTRKLPDRDPVNLISGTLGIAGASDTLWVMTRKRRSPEATLFITGRDMEESKSTLKFVDRIGWTFQGDSEEYKLSKKRQEVLDLLKENKDPLSPKEIAEETGQNINSVKSTLRQLEKEGLAIKTEYGKYKINLFTEIIPDTDRNSENSRNSSNFQNCENSLPIQEDFPF